MHSHSSVLRRASISVEADPSMDRASTVYRKVLFFSCMTVTFCPKRQVTIERVQVVEQTGQEFPRIS